MKKERFIPNSQCVFMILRAVRCTLSPDFQSRLLLFVEPEPTIISKSCMNIPQGFIASSSVRNRFQHAAKSENFRIPRLKVIRFSYCEKFAVENGRQCHSRARYVSSDEEERDREKVNDVFCADNDMVSDGDNC